MLCSRLKSVVNHIVAENQSAFVQGRSMMHNVLICHGLLRHYNRKTTPRCLMKIDLRKAYDMVSWEFLEEAMREYGFPDRFIQWTMTCVSTAKFTVKVNGEGFTWLPDFRFHPMCKNSKLTHMIFADDLMIFCKGNISSVNRVVEALDHFSRVTGLVDNMEKSNIFIAGVEDELKQ
ncbi:PREDICTED: uncharacterized protein LOC109236124 [Nicotiana attenuata]|uniref:uncharacterized protein LOC109236124 n=1 Tax=Nicotiana attenuata TaxID=49451 RepID=UPI0009059665|nr:PREDICTED: uncharacterized protein LOC109236124 [Nicotiana attenuata]